ncbi:hypothetical protein [Streptomyces sporangiiformans]|uniref:Uncharacterized protein n=1 Tax=Streptomyces sporangiiformans TaxID=2315329 RepID=A0A505D900_9ACTN|nr:hypothetical protein [Streptomyces sporangiiformans]TPQ18832.1 hypothetical protein FGD71_028780 [Streptomyces sporangiiformans]
MAINQKQMMQAVYDAIFDALTTTPPPIGGGRPILPKATTFMSFQLPGNPIDPAQFANPWSPTNPNGSIATAENFATLVDPVPVLSPGYAPSGASIDGLYGEIVRANVKPPPPDPAGEEAYNKAFNLLYVDGQDFDENGQPIIVKVDSPLYRNYKNKMLAYTAALTSYLTNYLQYDLSKPEDARKWAVLAPVLQAPVDMAYRDLQAARPGVVENAVATLGQYQQSTLANIFARARQTYEQTRKGSLSSPGLFWHACEAFPGNWFTESGAANFASQTIQSSRIRINESSRFSRYGAGGGVNFGLWRVGAAGSSERRQYDLSTSTSNITISFRYGRVEVRRRWLDTALASLHGWSTAGRRPGDYSTGQVDKNEGVFPLLTTSFIVARDIKISGNWSTSDLQFASQATSAGASVGWGPFSLSGSYSNSSSTRRFASTFDGTTITVPGAQIIAWLSSVVPYSPPTDGPPSDMATEAEAAENRRQIHRRNVYAIPYMRQSDNGFETAVAGDDYALAEDNGHSRFLDLDSEGGDGEGDAVRRSPDAPTSQFISAES